MSAPKPYPDAIRRALADAAYDLIEGAKDASWHQAGEAARAEVGRWLLARANRGSDG